MGVSISCTYNSIMYKFFDSILNRLTNNNSPILITFSWNLFEKEFCHLLLFYMYVYRGPNWLETGIDLIPKLGSHIYKVIFVVCQ